ncbi:MAG: OmpA family protein [Gammaproteobacteria bacterium]
MIRVKEQGSFPSGSATLRPTFIPIMDKIREAIKEIPGDYSVEGHTDDVPISTARFRSNWELSSARAVSVAHELMQNGEIDPSKFVVKGFGEVKPMVPNDTEDNRARNRRVEIVIEQGNEDEKYLSGEEKLPDDPEFTPDLLERAGLSGMEGFEIVEPDTQGDQQTISILDNPAPVVPEATAEQAVPAPLEQERTNTPPPQRPSDMVTDPFVSPGTLKPADDEEFF